MDQQLSDSRREPIAVIGSGCRFPGGSTTPSKLWELLKEPHEILSDIKKDRFNVDRYFHPDHKHHGTSNVRQSYFLDEDFKVFDAQFFGVKPQEALAMDPQQRILLETVYESLESAGITISHLQGSQTGVFVGNMGVDYSELLSQDIDAFPTYFAPGTARSILSNRISYFFDWHGPSVTIDTACSSSLVAVHQAVQSLRLGEIPVAIACGTNLLLGPAQYIAESKLKMLSPNGRSRMWDASADGYGRGEGFASIVLKTLSAALADGDHIECIIRETGVNQDGRTKGITMPSALAQQKLIHETYKRAGLDLSKRSDRPQYFEAHGTGTPAGDPVEAEAISSAFYGIESGFQRTGNDSKLYVGSIKTVIGHTEGTAGLAGLLKVSLAMKAGRIPPNLHFNLLAPAVKPFYKDLKIPTTLEEWPQPEPGQPLRASLNSFGFGGANAHAIIESYTPAPVIRLPSPSAAPVFAPFTFSATSGKALRAILSAYRDYLIANPRIDLRDLAFTLNQCRSTLSTRAVISATDIPSLTTKLEALSKETNPRDNTTTKSLATRPHILGVFTGQGAQWPRMGADLILSSPVARGIFKELEKSLNDLPEEDQPSWSLMEELLAPAESSRIHLAHISQTLCTAIQIVLVQLLRSAGVVFSAVVGHSSGEIAAAYTAGYLSASDAIRISYYRGLNLHLAGSLKGQQGGMMAFGTSFDDAKELCELDSFKDRLCVAASNSSSSVTLSGDLDAVHEAKKIADAEEKFNRLLQVDKAYHSHHMSPCFEPYVRSLQDCGIQVQSPQDATACPWISSVYADDIANVDSRVQDSYWGENLIKPVLFSQAISYALGGEHQFDYVIEVGPHPALKGPASQTISEVIGEKLPYSGCLRRNGNSVEALAECLGGLWSALGSSAVNLAGYESFLSGGAEQQVVKGLPSYKWDHERAYYFQSRLSKATLNNDIPTNELLGTRVVDDSATEVRWRNSLHSAEVPWLLQHHAQGQIVFPGMGYVSTALEAVKQLFSKESVRTVEVRDLVISNALMIEENTGIETLFSLTAINRSTGRITAHFSYLSQQGKDSAKLIENASGDLHVILGEAAEDALHGNFEPDNQMKDIDEERFYEAIEKLGYGYDGPFRALSKLQRQMGTATGVVAIPQATPFFDKMFFHPAALDATVQSILLAYCFPGDTRLQGIHLPTGIDSIRFNFESVSHIGPGVQLPFRSSVPLGDEDITADVGGDVEVFSEDGRFTVIQLQGLHTKPLSPPSAASDLHIFSQVVWKTESPAGGDMELHGARRTIEADMYDAMERVAYFYMRNVDREASASNRQNLLQHHVRFLEWVDFTRSRIEQGTLLHIRQEWEHDSWDDIQKVIAKHPESIDLQLMHAVGENLPAVFRGEMNALEPMVKENRLNRFYVDAMGMSQYTEDLARIAGHITHRYPHVNILEVGAGTGGATKVMLRKLDNAFVSYTYTDISSGFFGEARQVFKEYESKMTFKVLDIEKDIIEQGYEEHSFDIIIANLVVHATRVLEDSMAQLRRLLKPGGYLLLLEITDNDPLRFGFIFGSLPGWWLGHEDGRVYSPCVDQQWWNGVMRKTGFSGIDILTPHHSLGPLSVMVTQAVDDRVSLLREPTSVPDFTIDTEHLTIVGGAPALVAALEPFLKPKYKTVSVVPSIEAVLSYDLPVMGTVLSLIELYEPLFKEMTTQKLDGFKRVFQQSKSVYWITCGGSGDNPYSNMVVGMSRTIALEMRYMRLGFLDFGKVEDASVQIIADKFLESEIMGTLEQKEELKGLLWYREPELQFENGKFLVPRIRLSEDRNARYNSLRRSLTKRVDSHTLPISVVPQGESLILQESFDTVCAETRPDTVSIAVSYAILRSVKLTSSDYLFLVFGTDIASGKAVFALTDAQRSVVQVDRQWTIPYSSAMSQSKQTLVALYAQLLVQTAIVSLTPGDSLVVLDADKSLASAFSTRCAAKGVRLTLISTQSESKKIGQEQSVVYIHPLESKRSIKAKLPLRVSRFLNLSPSERSNQDVAKLIASCLPANCQGENYSSLTSISAHITTSAFLGVDCEVPSILRTCWAYAKADRQVFDPRVVTVVTPTDLAVVNKENTLQNGSLILIDWTATRTVSARIQPADSIVRFKQDKTYWLVGLTGGLALSLCRWMVDRGARYVVMTSRNPKIDQQWLRSVEALGATIRIFSSDVTKREALNTSFDTISATMPPIVGVVQGAMVLSDATFADTTLEMVDTILGPKVLGSIYLDEIFHSTPLDFFVFLSSIASTSGNPGQSIYGGSNTFMNSLAAQRRKRGVPGSSVEIGCIMGNGSVTSKLSYQQQQYLFSVGNMWLSEQDFLTMFAEAVLASPPDSPQSVTMSTGLRLHYNNDNPDITWFSNPIFQHLVLKTGNTMSATASTSKNGVSIKAQLQNAMSAEEVFSMLKDAFLTKIISSLQADADREVMDLPLETLGMDSLVAVDLRSWFLSELTVDVPVLKILNGGTTRTLLEFVQGILPKNLTPKLKSSDISATGAVQATQPKPLPQSQQPPVTPLPKSRPAPLNEPLEADSDSSSAIGTRTPSYTPSVDVDKTAVEVETISMSSVSSSFVDISQPKLLRTVPMSFGQSRFWFLRSFVSDPVAFNVTSLMRINGPLRTDDFARAVEKVSHRHEALRTSFVIENNLPVQKIWSLPAFGLEQRDIVDEVQVREAYEAIQNNVYELEEGKIMRIQLLSKSPTEHMLVLGYHHINMDGVSFEVLFSDLEKAYNGQPFSASVIQYPDFSMREAHEYRSGQWVSELAYWHTQFGDLPEPMPLLSLSKKTSRPAKLTYLTHIVKRRVSSEQSKAIQDVCRKFKGTPFHFFLAVFKTLIARYSSSEDICIGVADANRKESDVLDSIGLYLNLLPLRVRGQLTQTFGEAFAEMRRKSQEAFANSKVPFDILLNELNVPRSSSYAPLFQTFLNYRRGVAETRPFCGCDSSGELIAGGAVGYDITMDIVDNPEGNSLVLLAVQQDLYSLNDANMLLDNYFSLLDSFSKNPASNLNRPTMHNATAVDQALRLGCGSMHNLTWPATISHRIEDMSAKYATAVALKDGQGNESLTYAQLAARINTIATQLAKAGIDSGIVGVLQASTMDYICSILAIWQVGATYVPLDPRLSSIDRLAAIVRECEPVCILVDASTKSLFDDLKSAAAQVNVSALSSSVTSPQLLNKAKADTIAAVLFTSGSTGMPKGISLSHASIRNNIELAAHVFGFKEGSDVMLQQAAFSFDMSLSQTLTTLANGGTLVVAPTHLRGDAIGLTQLIASENVTFTQGTPTEYASWIGSGAEHLKGSKWRVAISGGEQMTKTLMRAFASLEKLELCLFNAYGPCETSFGSNTREMPYHELDSIAELPLATYPNYSIYIVDRDLKPVPAGVSGEICIGGACVGLGYFKNPKLTSEAFIADKYAPPEFTAKGWKTMYRSGDRGRLSSDGGLVIEGRLVGDTQIKFRGIRIDLRDIESAIIQAGRGRITNAGVSVRREQTESAPQFIVAHIVLGDNDLLTDRSAQQAFLAQVNNLLTLPLHMKPSLLVPVSKLPLGSSHKLDRRALQSLPILNTTQVGQLDQEMELTPTETEILELWKAVIPSSIGSQYSINPQTDFFHVGGSSLLLVNLQALLQNKYGKATPLYRIFESSTLAGMATLLAGDKPADEASLLTAINWDEETSLPVLSPAITPTIIEAPTKSPPRIAVLTGATGFLGRSILSFLLRQPSIVRVHCIAVRNLPTTTASPFSDPRVRMHKGDLKSSNLGLSPADAAAVFGEADVVIHNGADVSFLKTYSTLRLTNVDSTRTLARLVAPRRIPLHFVSSASVAQLTHQDEVAETSVAAWAPPTDARELAGGYTAAKWASEVLLEKAALVWGVPVTIHRPSSITGHGASELDLMGNLFKYIEAMEAVPDSSSWKGYIDFVSVENVAAEIVKAVVDGAISEETTGVRYLYEAGDIVYPLSALADMSEGGGRLPVNMMPLATWLQEATKRGLNPMLAEYLLNVDKAGSGIALPKLVKRA